MTEPTYIVLNENTLAYILPSEEQKPVGLQCAQVLSPSVIKGSNYRAGDSAPLPIVMRNGAWENDTSKYRPATKEDFESFRCNPPPGMFN